MVIVYNIESNEKDEHNKFITAQFWLKTLWQMTVPFASTIQFTLQWIRRYPVTMLNSSNISTNNTASGRSSVLEGNQALVFYLGGVPGLSPSGAFEFLAGQVVTSPKDRQLLADVLLEDLGFTSGGTSIGLLLPAVQKIRDAAARTKSRLNITDIGILQFLSGDPVSNPQDRLALVVVINSSSHFDADGKYVLTGVEHTAQTTRIWGWNKSQEFRSGK